MTSWRRYVRPVLNPTCSLFRCKIVINWKRFVCPVLNPTCSLFRCKIVTRREDMSVLFWIKPCQSSVHHLLELHRFLSYLPFFSLIYLLIYLMGVSPDGGLGSPRWRFFQILPLSNLIYSSSYRSTLINGFLLTKFCLKLIENTYLPI